MKKNRWFILACLVFAFALSTCVRVAVAGTESELAQVLSAGFNGLKAYFDWLLEVLKIIW